MATDGSIVIDSRIDQKGFNQGVKKMNLSLGGIIETVKKIGKLFAAAFIGGSIINTFRGIVQSFDLMSSSVGDKIKPLADAFETLKGTFVNLIITAFVPLIPFLMQIVTWLTNMLVITTQIVAALFGFKKTVGSVMTTAASNAKKAAKEARGALAAFDQINLLTKQDTPEAATGPTSTPGPLDVPAGLLDKVKEIRDIIASWFADPIGKLKETWGKIAAWFKANVIDPIAQWWNSTLIGQLIGGLWQNFTETWQRLIANASETFQTIRDNIQLFLTGINEFLTGVFTGDWALAWEGLKKIVAAVFGNIWAIISGTWNTVLIFLGGWIKAALIILQFWAGMINKLVLEPIQKAFSSALDWIKHRFESTFNAIRDFVLGVINSILSAIAAVAGALGSVGPGVVSGGIRPQIPHLATGAVIPPNAQFAAILGDQRSGRNIEAPEGLIRQIVREEAGRMQADISIRFEGSLSELVRQLKPHIDKEYVRVGGNLVKSGVTI